MFPYFFDITLKTTLELPKNYPRTTLTTLKVLFPFIHLELNLFLCNRMRGNWGGNWGNWGSNSGNLDNLLARRYFTHRSNTFIYLLIFP